MKSSNISRRIAAQNLFFCPLGTDGSTAERPPKRRALQDAREQNFEQCGCRSNSRLVQSCLSVQTLCKKQQQQIKDCETAIRQQQQLLMLQNLQLQASQRKCSCLLKLIAILASSSARNASAAPAPMPSIHSSDSDSSKFRCQSPHMLAHSPPSDHTLSIPSATTSSEAHPFRTNLVVTKSSKKARLSTLSAAAKAAGPASCSLALHTPSGSAATAAVTGDNSELRRLLEEALMLDLPLKQQHCCTSTQHKMLGLPERSWPQQQQQQQQDSSDAAYHSSNRLPHISAASNVHTDDHSAEATVQLQSQAAAQHPIPASAAATAGAGYINQQVSEAALSQLPMSLTPQPLIPSQLTGSSFGLDQLIIPQSAAVAAAGVGVGASFSAAQQRDASLMIAQPSSGYEDGLGTGADTLSGLECEELEADDDLSDLLSLLDD